MVGSLVLSVSSIGGFGIVNTQKSHVGSIWVREDDDLRRLWFLSNMGKINQSSIGADSSETRDDN